MVVLIFLPWEQTKLQIAKKYQMYLVTKIKQLAIPMCKVRSSLREHVCIVFICLGLQSRDVGPD